MRRGLITLLIIGLVAGVQIAAAQGDFQARTNYAVTVFAEPDRESTIVGVLIPQAKISLEARSADVAWVLARSADGTVRGWLEARYLLDVDSNTLVRLGVSEETMFVLPETNWDFMGIDLMAYPVVPHDLGQAAAIFAAGNSLGQDVHAVSKVGDCLTDNNYFLYPFGTGAYSLGVYGTLQGVIDNYAPTLTANSLAAYEGLLTGTVLDPMFANPQVCNSGESPLRCEYRVRRASVAVIMFGAQDLLFTSPTDFDTNLRRIVHESIQAGVVPVLSTFPANLARWDASVQYNQIVVQVALDYDVPLINLWRALDPLPHNGLADDNRHLSLPETSAGDLTQPNLQRGYPLRNLITLQALDAIWRGAQQ